MTTIAYKDGVVAYDSRITQGYYITTDNADKRIENGGAHFFLCGCQADEKFLIESFHGSPPTDYKNLNTFGLIWDGSKLYEAGIDKDSGYWQVEADLSVPRAIGSGSNHAITAMDMGADAKTAVKMAMKRDANTGGRVRIFTVDLNMVHGPKV